ncbi:hypothetical protein Bca4012_021392 [Brassica carinata]|uniref:Uncharacterized protein n=1 Tax=Brassica carinata TaxID=52824 RepID=A0A8X8B8P9_BRACI|nr:hypothetical protein Bca52824_000169 [Brassica carinata]
MARTNNKYNYSHILQRDPSSLSPASYSSVARSNGRMLVLTKPSPKPLKSSAATASATTTPPPPAPKTPDQAIIPDPDPNQISLRPLGYTGPAPSVTFPARHSESVAAPPPSVLPKPDKFVPPHLRPGFVRKDQNPPLDSSDPSQRLPHQQHQNQQHPRQGYGQLGRPRSGGYDRVRSDPEYLGRPRSSGKRPGTSG